VSGSEGMTTMLPAPARSYNQSAASHDAHHGDGSSTQARLMRRRGDLSKTSFSFNASLPAPRPVAHTKGLGLELLCSDTSADVGRHKSSLIVADVDNDPCNATPVAEWNVREQRQAHRGKGETHASLAIKAGDKICAVNGLCDDDIAMAKLLAAAGDIDSPKAVNLTLQRARSDVLGPQTMTAPPPPRSPRGIAGRERSNGGNCNTRHDSLQATSAAKIVEGVRSRRTSEPDVHCLDDRAVLAMCRRASDPEVLNHSAHQWNSLFHTAFFDMSSCPQKVEGESSTRAPSSSSSRRPSSSCCGDMSPPVFITSCRRAKTFAQAGLATLRC